MHLAIRVAEAGLGKRPAHRPIHGKRHVGASGGHGCRPVQVGRRVEVTDEEDGDAGRRKARQSGELVGERRQSRRPLQIEDLGERRPVAQDVRPVRIGRQVDVRDRDDPARPDLDVHVQPVRARRIDDRVAGDDLGPLARVPAERVGDQLGAVLALLEADDVRPRRANRLHDLRQGLGAAGGAVAPRPGVEVELVAAVEDVEGHDPQLDRWRGRWGSGRTERRSHKDRGQANREAGQPVPAVAHRGLLPGRPRSGGPLRAGIVRSHRLACPLRSASRSRRCRAPVSRSSPLPRRPPSPA